MSSITISSDEKEQKKQLIEQIKSMITNCNRQEKSQLYRHLQSELRVDFIAQLPLHLSIRILQFLDHKSLCRIAQLNKLCNKVSNNEQLWYRMCRQHIDKKCEKCGWSLPLMPTKRKHSDNNDDGNSGGNTSSNNSLHKYPWKKVYSDRKKVEANWRFKRYNTRILTNELCEKLFLDHSTLYTTHDQVLKIWDLTTWVCLSTINIDSKISSIQVDSTKIVIGTMTSIRIYNKKTKQLIRTLDGQSTSVHSNFNLLVSASGTRLNVWNIGAGVSFQLNAVNTINKVCIISSCLVITSHASALKFWNLEARKCIATITNPSPVTDFQPLHTLNTYQSANTKTPDDAYKNSILVCSSSTSTIHVYDITTRSLLKVYNFQNCGGGIQGFSFDKFRFAILDHNNNNVGIYNNHKSWNNSIKTTNDDSDKFKVREMEFEGGKCTLLSDDKVIVGGINGVKCFDFSDVSDNNSSILHGSNRGGGGGFDGGGNGNLLQQQHQQFLQQQDYLLQNRQIGNGGGFA